MRPSYSRASLSAAHHPRFPPRRNRGQEQEPGRTYRPAERTRRRDHRRAREERRRTRADGDDGPGRRTARVAEAAEEVRPQLARTRRTLMTEGGTPSGRGAALGAFRRPRGG